MSGVNWAMGLQQGPDPGQRFNQGFDTGRARANEMQLSEALRGYAGGDQSQLQTIYGINPTLGNQMETGAATRAASASRTAEQEIENNRDRFIAGAQFLQGVQDQATYAQRRQQFAQAGYDVSDIPEQYDPQYVQGVVEIGTRLQAAGQRSTGPTSFQRDLTGAGIDPNSDEGRRLLRNRYASPPRIMMVNGVPTLVSDGGDGDTPQVLTDEDIQRMDQGGPASPAPGNF